MVNPHVSCLSWKWRTLLSSRGAAAGAATAPLAGCCISCEAANLLPNARTVCPGCQTQEPIYAELGVLDGPQVIVPQGQGA